MPNRQHDIQLSLAESYEYIQAIIESMHNAVSDRLIQEVCTAKITSALMQFRACLDYSIKDIYDIVLRPHIGNPKGNIYFPYSLSREGFEESIKNNGLSKLKDYSPTVYNLIESLQSFSPRNDWLYILCKGNNDTKHNRHKPQTRIDSELMTINGQQAGIKIENGSRGEIVFINSQINENEIGFLDIDINNHVIITDEKTRKLNINLINWADFTFTDTKINIIDFLQTCYCQLFNYQKELYQIISSD